MAPRALGGGVPAASGGKRGFAEPCLKGCFAVPRASRYIGLLWQAMCEPAARGLGLWGHGEAWAEARVLAPGRVPRPTRRARGRGPHGRCGSRPPARAGC